MRGRGGSRSRRKTARVYHTYTVMAPDPFVAPYHAFAAAFNCMKLSKVGDAQNGSVLSQDEYPD